MLLLFTTLARAEPELSVPDPRTEAVSLTFAWPVGMACDAAGRVERLGLGAPADRTYTETERFVVQAHDPDLLLHQEAASVAWLTPRPTEPLRDPVGFAAQLGALLPDRVITRGGAFVGIEHLEAYRASVQAAWDRERAALSGGVAGNVEPMLDPFLDPVGLQRALSEAWASGVGFWVGKQLPAGATGMAITGDTSSLLPGSQVQWTYTFSVARWLPCEAGDPGEGCVELVYDGSAGRSSLALALETSGRDLLGEPVEGEVRWDEASLKVHGELVVDPATLVPFRELRESRLYVEARWGGDQVRFLDVTDRRQVSFACAVASAP